MKLPRYPVYVISKGRFENCLTAKFLRKDGVPFRLVVEPQEREEYAKRFGEECLRVLPFSNLGLGSIPARNWCWEHSISEGHERHWIVDDNIRCVYRRYRAQRMHCDSGPAFACTEDFVDRYENVGIAGLAYDMFVPDKENISPFYLNCHVYSCMTIMNSIPQRWRGRYNEDTDLCLQVLASGLCTVLVNAFSIKKMRTMNMKGGNTDQLYAGDGRLRMARSLERKWPHVVTVNRRFKRPQHIVRDSWGKWDTQLKLKPGIDLSKLPKVDEYGLALKQVAAQVKSPMLRAMLIEENNPDSVAGK